MLGRQARQGGRVLLRRDVHVRLGMRLPELVRVPCREERVRSALGRVGYGEPMTGHDLSSERAPTRARSLVDELMGERGSLLAFVRGRVRSGADAEDILQQALVKATEHADDVRDPERRRAWFFQILRRTLADHHAQWAMRESKLATLAADMEEATPEEVAVCACGLGQLNRLRPEYADLLRRVDVEEPPPHEFVARRRLWLRKQWAAEQLEQPHHPAERARGEDDAVSVSQHPEHVGLEPAQVPATVSDGVE